MSDIVSFPGRRAVLESKKGRQVLFVGGPADGCSRFVPDIASKCSASHTESPREAMYTRLTFNMGGCDTSVFVCGLTAAEAFERLVAHYRPDAP